MSNILHAVYDLSEFMCEFPALGFVEGKEVFNPLTRFDDEWAALIGAKEKHEEAFSVNRDGSIAVACR